MESPTSVNSPKENIEIRFQNFLQSITKPETLASFDPLEITLLYNNVNITISNIYGFNTLYDLKLAIYKHFDEEDFAAPKNQLLYTVRGPLIDVLDYGWENTRLGNPLSGKEKINMNFVTNDGDKKIVKLNVYDNLLIETRIKKSTIQLLFYKDMLQSYKGVRPISQKEYYGRIYPYFPHLDLNTEYPTENEKEILLNKYALFKKKIEYFQKIDAILSEENELRPIVFDGIRYLQLTWPKETVGQNIDSLFYNTDVNDMRPYIRLFPNGSVPISKVQLLDITNSIPNITPPELLKTWADEESPTPELDYMLGKIALKTTITNMPYLYATTRIFDDLSIDLVVQPPIRKIDPDVDFDNFSSDLMNGIEIFNPKHLVPNIKKIYIIFGIQSQQYTKKNFEKRLQSFQSIFQEIPPIRSEQPFAMLRYKLVDNFVKENNISTYLTLLSNKKLLKGDISLSDMVQLVSEEFQLDTNAAKKQVDDWEANQINIVKVEDGEKKEYVMRNNTGVDIAIFQTKTLYSIHIYNVIKVIDIQRIVSCLKMLFSLEDDQFMVTTKETKEVQRLEEVVSPNNSGDSDNNSESSDFELAGFAYENNAKSRSNSIHEEIVADVMPAGEELRNKVFPKIDLNQEDEDMKITSAKFFIDKLQAADPALFEYKHKPGEGYVSKCQANYIRQPAVLTQEQYSAMVEEYKDDDVVFQKYPLNEGEEDAINPRSNPDEVVAVLEYGSNENRPNFYVCGEYFCLRDQFIILKKDFKGTQMRRQIQREDGSFVTKKEPNTCPFCGGGLIKENGVGSENKTVIQRVYEPNKKNLKHFWVGLLPKSSHPDGLKLPCCFRRPHSIEIKDIQSGYKKKKAVKDEEVDDEEIDTFETGAPIIDYITTLYRITKKYIIDIGDRYVPMEIGDRSGPQIGILPKEVNILFEQDPSNIIERLGTNHNILPNAKGFLRIGVENRTRYQYDSFLAAIAPFYIKNSANQMKKRIREIITPHLYVWLNYGNLLLEFYNPEYETPKNIKKWAYDNLNIEVTENNTEEVTRIIKSYHAFEEFLYSEKTKEYRQFAELLAQPNLVQEGINRPGINFIVLDILEDDSVKIRCPPYGYNEEMMKNNDVAFLLHHYSGSWEPIFYVDNIVTGLENRQPYTMVFQRGLATSWPPIVKQLYDQFRRGCSGSGKTVYTAQSYIESTGLIPLSLASKLLYKIKQKFNAFSLSGILRDSYNHIIGVVCSEKKAEKTNNIVLPVIDDGTILLRKSQQLYLKQQIYLNWDDVEYCSLNDTIRIYNTYILPEFNLYREQYTPQLIAYTLVKNEEIVVGIQLANSLFVPVAKSRLSTINEQHKKRVIKVDEFEWDIDREIVFGNEYTIKTFKDLKDVVLKENDLEEIYQYLRITFGNWLAGPGSSVKDRLMDGYFYNSTISLNDKRKGLRVILGPKIQSWFSTETNESSHVSFLRKDCTMITNQEQCVDKCVWSHDNTCKIHITKKDNGINLANVLMFRLFDEILRYAEKRNELFDNEISNLVFLHSPIHIGDQYILPEDSIEWFDLLRATWIKEKAETPKFFEEISESPKGKQKKVGGTIPEKILNYLNSEDEKTKNLSYYEITKNNNLNAILQYMDIDPVQIDYSDTEEFSRSMLIKIIQRKKIALFQLNAMNSVNVKSAGLNNIEIKNIYILVITPTSSGFITGHMNYFPKHFEELKPIHYKELPNTLLALLE